MASRFATELERVVAKASLGIATAQVAPSADAYPSHWARTGDASATPPKRTSGAGLDYPAHWDTSPVDANATPSDRPGRGNTSSGERRPNGAGVDYPAHWKR